MRGLLLLIGIGSLLIASTGAAVEDQNGRYVAGNGNTLVFCSEDPRPLPPLDEPECTPAEAANTAFGLAGEERGGFGIGGFALYYGLEHENLLIVVGTDDAFYGLQTYLRLVVPSESGSHTSHGCGPQSVVLPSDGYGIVFALLPVLAVHPSDLSVCGATTGTY